MTAREVLNGRVGQRKYQPISCTNKKKQSSSPLPDEIIFCILLWLPADILYQSVRYVCRQWYNIIQDPHFIKEHLIRSVTGLLDHPYFSPHGVMFTEFGKMRPIVTEMSLPFLGTVLTTYNGLLLFEHREARTVHVVNPLTKQMVTLPQFCRPKFHNYCFALGYAKSKGEFKVVCPYNSRGDEASKSICRMLTLGKDHAWRLVHFDKLSSFCCPFWQDSSYSTGGFIFWADEMCPHIVALDLESEIFYEFRGPEVETNRLYDPIRVRFASVWYFERGNSLSCLVQCGRELLFDVWVLSESDPISGEWKKMFKIDMDAVAGGIVKWFSLIEGRGIHPHPCVPFLDPVAWVENADVVIFRSPLEGPYIGFNVKTGKSFKIGSCIVSRRHHRLTSFSYSLVSWTPS